MRINLLMVCCFTNRFYIKPQLFTRNLLLMFRCFTNRFYIKPQPDGVKGYDMPVALLIVSTSNRNAMNDAQTVKKLLY